MMTLIAKLFLILKCRKDVLHELSFKLLFCLIINLTGDLKTSDIKNPVYTVTI